MHIRKTLGALTVLMLLTQVALAQGTGDFKKYFNETAISVKATPDVEQKRAILETSLETMSRAIETSQRMGVGSDEDRAGLALLKSTVQDKLDELAGANGFDRVGDSQLNAFANYVVQDMQQAERTVTFSVVTLLLIILLVVLIS